MDINNVMPTPEDASKKYQKWFKYVGLAIIALIVLAIIISVIGALIPDKFKMGGKNSISSSINDSDEAVFIFNGSKLVTIDDDITAEISSVDYNYKQNYAIFLTESGELYTVNSKKSIKAAEDVTTYYLSAFGDILLYISDGDLYVGEISNAAKATKIDSDITSVTAISPNGDAFAYVNEDGDCFVSTNGKQGKEYDQKEVSIFAISDNGKYVYYKKESGFYVNDTKLADSESSCNGRWMNRDGTQLIYSSTSGEETKTYMVVKGKEKISLVSGQFYGVLSPNGASVYKSSISYCNVSSFAKCALSVGENYYLLKNTKGDTEKLSELKNASYVSMLEDGKTVLFIKNSTLKSYNVTNYKGEAKEYDLDKKISSFSCTTDGKYIYVRDTDNTLYYVKSDSKLKKIDDDVSSNYVAVKGGKVYYVTEDNELYYANKSDSVKKIISDDVKFVGYYSRSNVIYTQTTDAYYTVSGKKAKKLFSTSD